MPGAERPVVLVTGAAGFIGARIAEVLHCGGVATVRAGVRRWASAARVGRLPVDIVQCDVTRPDQVAAAMDGVDIVVHCAVGGRDVTVDGTRNVLEEAQRRGVRRVVHISTIDVYGDATGAITEESQYGVTGRPYGDSKIEAEQLCMTFAAKGVPVTMLRPSIVYGPFSDLWTVEFAKRLQMRPWLLAEEVCQGTCNLVYVDDLVQAIILAMHRPEAIGQAFNVNGPDRPTWHRYFSALNDAMGLPPLEPKSATASKLSARVMKPVKGGAKLLLKHFQPQIMAIYQRSSIAKAAMRKAEQAIRQAPNDAEFRLYGKVLTIETEKAERLLGYRPRFDMARGLALSASWLRHAGYAPAAATPVAVPVGAAPLARPASASSAA
jgi:nucleoside-diphosphate-sugar epimerase